jgi:bifunctional non-homologous end joining protein LigD
MSPSARAGDAAARKAASTPSRKRAAAPAVEAGADAPRITHPERVVYASGVTKGDVAAYYTAVASRMLPELANRPLSLIRCPDGTEGTCFFQKHWTPMLGKGVGTLKLRQKDGIEDYLYVRDLRGLLALVQMNAIEFHPWGSRVDKPELPDRLVFDLDPDAGMDFPRIVAAARQVRARLRALGLESFVRSTGGKGLHVVAPIDRGPSWDAAKAFSEAFADAMEREQPETYVATMSKAKRIGRIFVDWLRNARGATAVTSWSLRARPGAPVAMPLRWEELGKLAGGNAFDITTAVARARRLRADPWPGFHALRQKLPRSA